MPRFAKRVAAAVAAAGLVGGAVATLVVTAPFAAANQEGAGHKTIDLSARRQTGLSTLNANFDCRFPVIGHQTLETSISGLAPSSVRTGQPFSTSDVQLSVTLPAPVVGALMSLTHSLSGTISNLVFRVRHARPGIFDAASQGIAFGPVPLSRGEAATITAPSVPVAIGPFRASSRGPVRVIPLAWTMVTQFGTVSCAHPRPANLRARSDWTIRVTKNAQPVPLGSVGGVGLAVLFGAGFAAHQRRRRRARARAAAQWI